MKIDLTKDQRVMILSCINERAALYKDEIKKYKGDPIDKLKIINAQQWVKIYEKRLKTISELKEMIKLKK